jgi:RNA-directed DNA polymerase
VPALEQGRKCTSSNWWVYLLTPLISYSSPGALKESIRNSDLGQTFDERLFDELLTRGLPPLTSPTVLASILGVSPKLITAMGRSPERYYRRFTIPKKSGGERTILAPRSFLKAVQYYILRFVLESQPFSAFTMGFVRGRGIVHNARLHVGSAFVLNVDIQDFFGSVTLAQVRRLYDRLGFPVSTADALAQLCTFHGSLPQGAPTSPALSNLVFADADRTIAELAGESQLTYSRYADDLSFSGAHPIRKSLPSELSRLLAGHGFRLNPAKTRFAGPGQAKYVTGLVVNVRPQVDRRTRRKLRAMFHQAQAQPDQFRSRAHELLGWASFVNSFDADRGEFYVGVAKSLLAR